VDVFDQESQCAGGCTRGRSEAGSDASGCSCAPLSVFRVRLVYDIDADDPIAALIDALAAVHCPPYMHLVDSAVVSYLDARRREA